MKVTFWGCRGSIASAGPETLRYGGNTACVQVSADDGTTIFLDAGTGLRRPAALLVGQRRLDILLSHLHMDHIQGLGFFRPFFDAAAEVHVWGPPSTTATLRTRLTHYLSPPLFPVRINDLPSRTEFHDAPRAWEIGPLRIESASILHPGPTVGYRIAGDGSTMAYLSDHEPILGGSTDPRWTSGFALAAGVDLLVHDAQYTEDEYASRVGWGHSSVAHTASFAMRAGAKRVALFHHDPDHDDATLDGLLDEVTRLVGGRTLVLAAQQDAIIEL
jgi:phosphoribosyl 1,2-cyclic phosphodiesterase